MDFAHQNLNSIKNLKVYIRLMFSSYSVESFRVDLVANF